MNDRIQTHPCPYALKLNLKEAPFGVSPDCLRMTWRQPDGGQTARRVRVFRGTACDGDPVYDSGFVPGADCVSVPLRGLDGMLPSPGLYAWQVCVRDTDGEVSAWSQPQAFSVDDGKVFDPVRGITVPDGIWPALSDALPEGCAPGVFGFVRQSFILTDADLQKLDRLLLTAAARSPEKARQYVYTLFVNGHTLGVGPARYGETPDGRLALYTQTYDATPYLCAGENVIAAWLACTAEPAARMFACRGLAYGKDGSVQSLLSPDGWQGLDGTAALRPRHSIGTHYFTAYASDIDGTVYPFGFDRPGFDASGWLPCESKGALTAAGLPGEPAGGNAALVPSGCDIVTRIPLTDPAPVLLPLGQGRYLVDLGQEIIGSLALHVPDFAGSAPEITLYFGEQCRQAPGGDGTWVKWDMNTSNRYLQRWVLTPGRTFETQDMMAFRYVELVGLPFTLTADAVRGMALCRPFRGDEASMTSSSPLLNGMYHLTRRTIELTTQDIYVDSQSRERGAYEGDMLINELTAYTFEDDYAAARFSLEYLYTHRTWPADYILWILEAAMHDYTVTGDDSSLRAWYPCLREKTFTRYLSDDLNLLHSGNFTPQGTDAVLVDWPNSERDGYDMTVRYNTVLNCVAVAGYEALSQIARVVGEEADAEAFAALAARVKSGILTHLYDPETGDFSDGLYADGSRCAHVSQHSAAYALYAGVYADAETADRIAARMLERSTSPDPDGTPRAHIRMSVYGSFFLLMGLYKTGHGREANALLLDEHDDLGERTYAYMLRRAVGEEVSPFGAPVGATLTTEAWNRLNKPNMTYSHPWGAAPAACMARGIFGITPTAPGYASFVVRPRTAGLVRGTLTLPTLRGVIAVSFDNEAGTVNVEAPVGTVYTVEQ